jgi:hypothetical protein
VRRARRRRARRRRGKKIKIINNKIKKKIT